MKTYIYLGVAKNQTATFVDVDDTASGRDPADHARRLLADHNSCDRVEVWRDDERIAVVERELGHPRP
jgi:hypothetical protein